MARRGGTVHHRGGTPPEDGDLPMHILITDRNFQGEPLLERETAGKGAEIEIFDAPDQVSDAAWERADAVVTYRGKRVVTAKDRKRVGSGKSVEGRVGHGGGG